MSTSAPTASSKRLVLLRKAHETAIGNWAHLLSRTPGTAEPFRKAFRAALQKYPDAAAADAAGGGVLVHVMRREFPTLARLAPDAFSLLAKDVLAAFPTAAHAEFGDILKEAGMEGKMAELERREAAARAADADRAADRPRPMELAPQDELRSVAVEAKLAYEAQLRRELEKVRVASRRPIHIHTQTQTATRTLTPPPPHTHVVP
jgi:hypothetical protein